MITLYNNNNNNNNNNDNDNIYLAISIIHKFNIIGSLFLF